MPELESLLSGLGITFALVLARVGALVATAPLLATPTLPLRIKALLAVSMAAVVTPLQLQREMLLPETLSEIISAVANDALIGATLGLGVMVILSGIQLTGQVIGQMSGMALTDGTDPILQDNATVFSQIFYFVTVAVFVAAGGHSEMIDVLLSTFDSVPPGAYVFQDQLAITFLGLLSAGFELGLRTSAPLMVGLFLATVVLGLISRTLPQINTVVVGFSINGLLTLGLMMLSVGAVAWAYQGPLSSSLAEIASSVTTTPRVR
ncbi:flagellar biosynthetic protein FliR [Botrimarina hoheduenensis]|uniref:Flagellar biosynthesis protein FliR n=1 Tax=Botrimarina hoheduenensis TaxID=2528000 RepID=A0A5C5VYH5_9BACT|nr:flagellar biosynthetic protein FliR [Botrimarina hoheduenensis]TWT43197.1 flagellar biosynthesis protein FliR [Botrimarina hoheduenensis]